LSVSAQISVYPLRQQHLGPTVEVVRLALASGGLEPEVGPMSTLVRGDVDTIFAALREAWERASTVGDVTMVLTLSNACPADVRGTGVVGDL
jgi:uncharacterized protein YqgV (UPF0045/DUF77 family)